MDRHDLRIVLIMLLLVVLVVLALGASCVKDTFREQYGTITDFRIIPGGFGQPHRCEIETTTTKVAASHFDCDNLVVGKRLYREGNNCTSKIVIE